ncbi:hypothetical protein TIFTF001_040777 [Ficus carica]|uniref:Protein kinase domain-containing protein n=1 Tax=Ficus carica TaxID=3494 RepID=A0AA87YYC7_FICCA|nr:hypothetical protein TIFTF001_040777 [Ficus carica]
MARTFVGDQTVGNTNRVVGTYGYMALEYAFRGQFSTKSDVFGFGIMILEIEVLRCIHVGLLCVQQRPVDRPNMPSVILMLGNDSELPEPKPPGYFTETDSQERVHISRKPDSFSKNTITMAEVEGR